MTSTEPKVQIISAAQVPGLLEQILAIRNPELHAKRRRGRKNDSARAKNWNPKVKDKKITIPAGADIADAMGLALAAVRFTEAPKRPVPLAHGVGVIGRSSVTDLNRDLNDRKVRAYLSAMIAGEWVLAPDAVAITAEGLVINGQHRLEAARRYGTAIAAIHSAIGEGREGAEARINGVLMDAGIRTQAAADYLLDIIRGQNPGPQFIVAWNITKDAALFMDEAARSTDDRRTIALRYAQVATA